MFAKALWSRARPEKNYGALFGLVFRCLGWCLGVWVSVCVGIWVGIWVWLFSVFSCFGVGFYDLLFCWTVRKLEYNRREIRTLA